MAPRHSCAMQLRTALERIGAAAVLRELAKGAADALLTREAKASLARLEARLTDVRPARGARLPAGSPAALFSRRSC
jgi:hypothetical protein